MLYMIRGVWHTPLLFLSVACNAYCHSGVLALQLQLGGECWALSLLVQIKYDPKQTSYKELLKVFLEQHDPTSLNKQGGDTGSQYRSGLYFHTPKQRQIAEQVMAEAAASFQVCCVPKYALSVVIDQWSVWLISQYSCAP